MSLKMLRKYQAKMLWPFVILIIVTFGITGIMTDVLSSWRNYDLVVINGKGYSGPDIDSHQQSLRHFLGAMQQTGSGLVAYYLAGDEEIDLAVNYITFMDEAKRLGITVSEKELTEKINAWYRDLLVYEQIQREFQQMAMEYYYLSEEQLRSIFYQQIQEYNELPESEKKKRAAQLDKSKFNSASYREFVGSLGYKRVQDFEHMFANKIVIEKLVLAATSSGAMTTEEIYKWYLEDNEERNMEVAVFDPRNFETDLVFSLAEIEEYFAQNEKKYLRPENVDIEYILADQDRIKEEISKSPITDEELRAFYNENSGRYPEWRDDLKTSNLNEAERGFSAFFLNEKSIPSPKPVAKPFVDIAESVKEKYIESKVAEKAKGLIEKAAQALIEETNMLAGMMQTPESLSYDSFKQVAQALNLESQERTFVRPKDNWLMFKNGHISDEDFALLFQAPLYELSKPIKLEPQKGYMAYRVTKRRLEDIPSIDQTQKEVERDLRIEKSKALALDAAGRFALSARETMSPLSDVGFDKQYFTFTTGYLKDASDTALGSFQMNKLNESATWLTQRYHTVGDTYQSYLAKKIINAGFGTDTSVDKGKTFSRKEVEKAKIEKVGDVSDPFCDNEGRVYVVRLLATRKPNPEEFRVQASEYAEYFMNTTGKREFFSEWRKDLRERAKITFPGRDSSAITEEEEVEI